MKSIVPSRGKIIRRAMEVAGSSGVESVQISNVMRVLATCAAIVMVGVLNSAMHAQTLDPGEALLIQQRFQMAPVELNLAIQDRNLVGLCSYLVNAAGACNGCHTGGGPPNFKYANGGNPYFNQPKKVDPAVYLSGGQNFGLVGAQSALSIYLGQTSSRPT